ncbi:hypothetical protein BBJ29_009052 [Phytophthora kernoviae]|uniref:MYND-type domain-containing protein n=1 Tax=Phytophthora kernoviae TaxID=325452 RepID=A0A3F2S3A6_9STRA|nr:hypothetical protein BBJ29_009052 [Phytophthora kernoviae]RLN68724.1 hypothetical protein BBP00_00000862 [Phytophthora kernoviae]
MENQTHAVGGGDVPVLALCENCGQPSRHRCSRCKAFVVCGKECMKAVWSRHKPDCDTMVGARKMLKDSGTPVSGVPFSLEPDALLRLNARTLEVYRKHGVEEPPKRGSSMDVRKKLEFFLDVLREHDTSSLENRDLPLGEKLFLNCRYNNSYRYALETFTPNEINQLNGMMRTHHVA